MRLRQDRNRVGEKRGLGGGRVGEARGGDRGGSGGGRRRAGGGGAAFTWVSKGVGE